MSTPICHRTIGPERHWNYMNNDERNRGAVAENGECIGSRCAMWVRSANIPVSGRPITDGHGACADNPHAAQWADPAKATT